MILILLTVLILILGLLMEYFVKYREKTFLSALNKISASKNSEDIIRSTIPHSNQIIKYVDSDSNTHKYNPINNTITLSKFYQNKTAASVTIGYYISLITLITKRKQIPLFIKIIESIILYPSTALILIYCLATNNTPLIVLILPLYIILALLYIVNSYPYYLVTQDIANTILTSIPKTKISETEFYNLSRYLSVTNIGKFTMPIFGPLLIIYYFLKEILEMLLTKLRIDINFNFLTKINKYSVKNVLLYGYPIISLLGSEHKTFVLCLGITIILAWILMSISNFKNKKSLFPISKILLYISLTTLFLPTSELSFKLLGGEYFDIIKLTLLISIVVLKYIITNFIKSIPNTQIGDNNQAPIATALVFFCLFEYTASRHDKLVDVPNDIAYFYVKVESEFGESDILPAKLYVENNFTGREFTIDNSLGNDITVDEYNTYIMLKEILYKNKIFEFNNCEISLDMTWPCKDTNGKEWRIQATEQKVKKYQLINKLKL